jgi:uncharacterized protein YcbK (DUF882 family)
MNWADIKHFKPTDFNDHHGVNKGENMDLYLVSKLDTLRDMVGFPIIVTAAYDSQGHAPRSYHYSGRAIDFIILTRISMRDQWTHIVSMGFGGIGVYPGWTYKDYEGGWHVDNRMNPQVWKKEGDGYVYFLP